MERTWNVDGNGTLTGYVEKLAGTKLSDGEQYPVKYRFQLDGLTLDELMAPALKSWVISAQSPARKFSPAEMETNGNTWNTTGKNPSAKMKTADELQQERIANAAKKDPAIMAKLMELIDAA